MEHPGKLYCIHELTRLLLRLELPNLIAPGHNGQVREDKKWFKVEIRNVKTGAFDYNGSGIYTPQMIHQHLREVNPEYAALSVVMLPRWIWPENELNNQPYSSVIFIVDSFDQHAHFPEQLKLWLHLASTRKWTDCPPITQCHCWWCLDHCTTTCEQPPWYRICGEEHEESHHYNLLAPTTDNTEM